MLSKLSIVVPVFNEVDNIIPLYESVCAALDDAPHEFELIMVDDGSDDGSQDRLKSLVTQDDRVKVIRLRRNFGQTIAMQTGIQTADGDVIVTMDGDLQNDPQDIPNLIAKIESGYDVVSGWRRDRKDHLFSRKIPSRIANWCIRKFLGIRVHDFGCTLRAYRSELICQIPLYADLHRFIPAMCSMATSRITEVEVQHHHRKHGVSKYGLSRTWRVLIDALTLKMLLSCANRPFYWFGFWAFGVLILTVLAGIATIATAIYFNSLAGNVFPGITILFGYLACHLLFAGIFSDLVIRYEPGQRVVALVDVIRSPTSRPSPKK